jgi:hypothetical protein
MESIVVHAKTVFDLLAFDIETFFVNRHHLTGRCFPHGFESFRFSLLAKSRIYKIRLDRYDLFTNHFLA